MNPQKFLERFKEISFTLPTVEPSIGPSGARQNIKIFDAIQNYGNNLQSGQFNHTQYGNNPYLGNLASDYNNPFQFLLNTTANYRNMGN